MLGAFQCAEHASGSFANAVQICGSSLLLIDFVAIIPSSMPVGSEGISG